MAHRAADLALELGHAGFARVVGDDGLQRLHAQLALVFSQAVGLALPFCSGGKLQRLFGPGIASLAVEPQLHIEFERNRLRP